MHFVLHTLFTFSVTFKDTKILQQFILCFVCRNLLNPHIQDGYEQSESKRETAPRGEQSAVCEEPAIQDHIRGNVSTILSVFHSYTLLCRH